MSYNVDNIRSGNTVTPWVPPPAADWLSGSVFSPGIAAAMANMLFQGQTNQGLVNKLNERMKDAREATEMAGLVEAAIADMADPKAKGTLPQSVINYMKDNNIRVDGKTIGDFLGGENGSLTGGKMEMVKTSLESVASAASDFNQQAQLKIQDVMGKYSASSKMVESIQSMQAEMVKGVAAAIR